MNYRSAFSIMGLIFSSFSLVGQDWSVDEHTDHSGFRIATFIGHTLIPDNRGEKHFFVPSYGIDLEYWLNRYWGFGWHNDIELETFVVETDDEDLLERAYPFISTLDVLFKMQDQLVLMVGAGYEFERESSFFILRFGVEAKFAITHSWDVFPTVFYDTATGGRSYSTVTIGLGIGKHF